MNDEELQVRVDRFVRKVFMRGVVLGAIGCGIVNLVWRLLTPGC